MDFLITDKGTPDQRYPLDLHSSFKCCGPPVLPLFSLWLTGHLLSVRSVSLVHHQAPGVLTEHAVRNSLALLEAVFGSVYIWDAAMRHMAIIGNVGVLEDPARKRSKASMALRAKPKCSAHDGLGFPLWPPFLHSWFLSSVSEPQGALRPF